MIEAMDSSTRAKPAAENPAPSRLFGRMTPPPRRRVQASFSNGFGEWILRHRLGIVATACLRDRVIFIGAQPGGQPVISAAALARPTGLAAFSQRIYVGCDTEIWRLENVLSPNELAGEVFDRVYVPRNMQVTGDVGLHDLGIEASGRIIFASTKFSCVATVSTSYAFKPIWKPKFISKIAPEDRCHLNGLGIENGKLHYVTTCSASDVADGWRGNQEAGGVLIDTETDALLADGLSMPHSPRVYGSAIYLLESGRGVLSRVCRRTGKKNDIARLHGLARGLAFKDHYAIVTVSPRPSDFSETPSHTAHSNVPWRGLQIIDLNNGDIVEWLLLEGEVSELFDVAIIPEIKAPRGVSAGAWNFEELLRVEPL